MMVDIGIAVEQLLGEGVDYGSANTYADLQRSWRDQRTIPSLPALQMAWDAYVAAQDAQQQAAATLKAAIVTTARGAEGKALNVLTAVEVRALIAVMLYKAGGVNDNGTVKPLNSWV